MISSLDIELKTSFENESISSFKSGMVKSSELSFSVSVISVESNFSISIPASKAKSMLDISRFKLGISFDNFLFSELLSSFKKSEKVGPFDNLSEIFILFL